MYRRAALGFISGLLSTVFFLDTLVWPSISFWIAIGGPGVFFGLFVLAWMVPKHASYRFARRVVLVLTSWASCAAAVLGMAFLGTRVLPDQATASLASVTVGAIVSGVAAVIVLLTTRLLAGGRLRLSSVMLAAGVGIVAGGLFCTGSLSDIHRSRVLGTLVIGATFVIWQLGMAIVLERHLALH